MMAANVAARPKGTAVERLKRREQRLTYGPAAFNSTPTGAIQPICLNLSPIGQPLLREDVVDATLSPTFIAQPSASSAASPSPSADAPSADSPPAPVFAASRRPSAQGPKPPAKRRAEVPFVLPTVDSPVAVAGSTPPAAVSALAARRSGSQSGETPARRSSNWTTRRPPQPPRSRSPRRPFGSFFFPGRRKPADSPALPVHQQQQHARIGGFGDHREQGDQTAEGRPHHDEQDGDGRPPFRAAAAASVPAVTQQLEGVELNARGRPKRAAAPDEPQGAVVEQKDATAELSSPDPLKR
ncbi:hypothetical protein M3Y99_01685500 [Aphelenchoides fujianensis]|nr:hypothetical protein M3Y99_01685500 [Aphelenchoides fujianensis]